MNIELSAIEGAPREVLEADRAKAAAARREADVQRHENELKHAFLTTPGATEEQWTKERDAILAQDRAAQALRNKNLARQSQAPLYRRF